MKHLAQRIILGLAFIAQATFGGASARAQLFVPPPEKILPALDLSAAAVVAAATPAPVKSATITSTAATLDPKKRDPLPPTLEAPSVIATRGPILRPCWSARCGDWAAVPRAVLERWAFQPDD